MYLAVALAIGFNGCSEDEDSVAVNTNKYDLAKAMITPYSGLLDLTYSTGATGSLYISKTVIGDILVNGQTGTLLSQPSTVSVNGTVISVDGNVSIDSNGNTIQTVSNDGSSVITCNLTSSPEAMPVDAQIGAKSNIVRTYNCDDGSLRATTWELKDAGNGNAIFAYRTIVSGAYQSETFGEYTFTPDLSPIYVKMNFDYKNGITAEAKGQLN